MWNKPYSKRLYDVIQSNVDLVNHRNRSESMGKVKQLWQDEIDRAIGEYHDEISLHYGWKDSKSVQVMKDAKVRLVSKLYANGCESDHIEQIVDTECP